MKDYVGDGSTSYMKAGWNPTEDPKAEGLFNRRQVSIDGVFPGLNDEQENKLNKAWSLAVTPALPLTYCGLL